MFVVCCSLRAVMRYWRGLSVVPCVLAVIGYRLLLVVVCCVSCGICVFACLLLAVCGFGVWCLVFDAVF